MVRRFSGRENGGLGRDNPLGRSLDKQFQHNGLTMKRRKQGHGETLGMKKNTGGVQPGVQRMTPERDKRVVVGRNISGRFTHTTEITGKKNIMTYFDGTHCEEL